MESQRRRMIWFEITKRRLIEEQNQKNICNNPQEETPLEPTENWDNEDDYVSQR